MMSLGSLLIQLFLVVQCALGSTNENQVVDRQRGGQFERPRCVVAKIDKRMLIAPPQVPCRTAGMEARPGVEGGLFPWFVQEQIDGNVSRTHDGICHRGTASKQGNPRACGLDLQAIGQARITEIGIHKQRGGSVGCAADRETMTG